MPDQDIGWSHASARRSDAELDSRNGVVGVYSVMKGCAFVATKSPAGIALGLIQRGGGLANDDQIVVGVHAITAAWRQRDLVPTGRVRMSEASCTGCGRAQAPRVVLPKPPINHPRTGALVLADGLCGPRWLMSRARVRSARTRGQPAKGPVTVS
jgi:hypothetical protein